MFTRRACLMGLGLGLGIPVGHAGSNVLARPIGKVILTVSGHIGRSNSQSGHVDWDLSMLEGLPQASTHTRTPWDKNPTHFSGPLLRDLLGAVQADGEVLQATALNDYRIHIPIADAYQHDVILAIRVNGLAVPVRSRGPLMVMYPFDRKPELKNSVYYERCIWQLRHLTVR